MSTDVEALALRIIELAQAGRFTEIRKLFPQALRVMVSAKALEGAWTAEAGRRGSLTGIGAAVTDPVRAGVTIVRVPLRYERSNATLVVSVTRAGQVAGLQLAPESASAPVSPWEPPDYAAPERLQEEEVVLGDGSLAVPGTLTLPRSPGPHPAVLLLAGSGPLDRDSSVGRNKPFKDLAWGLASLGVAVVRFDKVTFAHGEALQKLAAFTVQDEYMIDAHSAVSLLANRTEVDARRIFVLGHSLGGTVAPRVAAADPRVAGLIIAAGGAEPLHRAILRQLRYLASLDPATQAAAEEGLARVARQVDLVEQADLSPDTPAASLPLGVPASYWLDLRAYDPVAAAAALERPILILQGGRDYQVTIKDDLERWRAGLAGRPNVVIRVYEADNHMFLTGSGSPTPTEYEPAQHVDPMVVTTVAEFVSGRGQ